MIVITRLMALIMGYFCGCFPTGYLVGKRRGVDIRKHGSGNTGATNTLRTLGWAAAAITFIGDCAKTILAIILANVLFKNSNPKDELNNLLSRDKKANSNTKRSYSSFFV